MKTICAWCGKHLSGDPDAKVVPHGICELCAAEMSQEIDEGK